MPEFAKAERERQEQVFKPFEAVTIADLAIAACAGVYALAVRATSI